MRVPGPNDAVFAVLPKDLEGRPINNAPWQKQGKWKWREFGSEIQLSGAGMPWLRFDLFRVEAEELCALLGFILNKPMPVIYRLSKWERLKQWWMRKVWARKHHAELAAARKALVEEFNRTTPWG